MSDPGYEIESCTWWSSDITPVQLTGSGTMHWLTNGVATTKKATKPQPTAIAGPNDGEVTISWPMLDGATQYWVFEVLNGDFRELCEPFSSSKTSIVAQDLSAGKDHVFLVRAEVDGEWTPFTSEDYCSAVPFGPTYPVLNDPVVVDKNVTLTWGYVPGATKYSVSIKPLNGEYTTLTENCVDETFSFDVPERGQTYLCLVRAYVDGSWTAMSDDYAKQVVVKCDEPIPATEPVNTNNTTYSTVNTGDDMSLKFAILIIGFISTSVLLITRKTI